MGNKKGLTIKVLMDTNYVFIENVFTISGHTVIVMKPKQKNWTQIMLTGKKNESREMRKLNTTTQF